MTERRMTVEVWSDVMCPWCYLGKRRFARALTQFAHRDDVDVVWRSFQLMPSLRTNPSISIDQFLAGTKGIDPRRAAESHEHLAALGRQEGIVYHFDQLVVANTFKAHRFTHFAKARGKQDEAVDSVFSAYFTDGRNIDDSAVLLQLGEQLGFDRERLSAALSDGAYADDVRADIEEAGALGISGVPFFVLDRTFAVSGAQSSAVFLQALDRAYHDSSATSNEQQTSF